MQTQQQTAAETGLTLERARQLFERTPDGKPDYTIVHEFYHPDLRFQDPLQELRGRDAFIEMSDSFVGKVYDFEAKIDQAAQTGNVIFLQWTMHYRFGKPTNPVMRSEGTTKLELNEQGQVVLHRDYFDMWGDAIRSFKPARGLYDRLMKKMG